MATNTTALASRFRVDLTEDLDLAGGWTQLVGMNDLKPNVAQNLVETSSYDNDGFESYEKTFQGWSLVATCWMRTVTGLIHPSLQLLVDRELAWGDGCRIGVRWYDKNGVPEAFQGVAVVQTERGNTGVKDPETKTFTLQGDGVLTPISNPGTAASVPVISSVSPSTGAAAGGELVTIIGTGFTGVAGVTFDGVAAEDYQFISDVRIAAVTPAGVAGPAAVVVTNGVGPSTTGTTAYTYV
jgi:IPT/TIG domain.